MRLISWNVNGLRACIKKGFLDFFEAIDADFFCIQETKLQEGHVELDISGYEDYWCYAEKKGYSGTAVFAKKTPISVIRNFGTEEHNDEGRVLTLEYENFYLVCTYSPNAQDGLRRIDYRMEWEDAFRAFVTNLDMQKPVIICGDLNVAHQEIDLKHPKANRGNAGFSDEEREKFTELIGAGFTDTFRYLHPDARDAYTWWSYRPKSARANNSGWRIDYFLCSDRLRDKIDKAYICPEIMGSDHCPVGLDIEL
jgi:exodeoxyribonuclease-3